MAAVNAYLNFNGNCEEAFEFYRSVFAGNFTQILRYNEVEENCFCDIYDSEKIIHIALPIGRDSMIMGSDLPAGMPMAISGSNICLAVSAVSESEATKFFLALSHHGKILVPLEKAFWGAYFGMLRDKYGIRWMIDFEGQ